MLMDLIMFIILILIMILFTKKSGYNISIFIKNYKLYFTFFSKIKLISVFENI